MGPFRSGCPLSLLLAAHPPHKQARVKSVFLLSILCLGDLVWHIRAGEENGTVPASRRGLVHVSFKGYRGGRVCQHREAQGYLGRWAVAQLVSSFVSPYHQFRDSKIFCTLLILVCYSRAFGTDSIRLRCIELSEGLVTKIQTDQTGKRLSNKRPTFFLDLSKCVGYSFTVIDKDRLR